MSATTSVVAFASFNAADAAAQADLFGEMVDPGLEPPRKGYFDDDAIQDRDHRWPLATATTRETSRTNEPAAGGMTTFRLPRTISSAVTSEP